MSTAEEILTGTSLWKDARRRLMRNRLAVVGIVLVTLVVVASIIGPLIIYRTTGYTYDYIPRDAGLVKSMAPFRGPDGAFSWLHPMGTDIAGRDILARV